MRQNKIEFCESVNAMTIEQRGEYLKLELAVDFMLNELDNLLENSTPLHRPMLCRASKTIEKES